MWELWITKDELEDRLNEAALEKYGGIQNLIDAIEYYRAACVSDRSETYRWLTARLRIAVRNLRDQRYRRMAELLLRMGCDEWIGQVVTEDDIEKVMTAIKKLEESDIPNATSLVYAIEAATDYYEGEIS